MDFVAIFTIHGELVWKYCEDGSGMMKTINEHITSSINESSVYTEHWVDMKNKVAYWKPIKYGNMICLAQFKQPQASERAVEGIGAFVSSARACFENSTTNDPDEFDAIYNSVWKLEEASSPGSEITSSRSSGSFSVNAGPSPPAHKSAGPRATKSKPTLDYSSDSSSHPKAPKRSALPAKLVEPRGTSRFFESLASLGAGTFTKESLSSILDKFKTLLVTKNVANEVAELLCAAVAEKLEGSSSGLFSSRKLVTDALESKLVEILTPSKKIDILASVSTANSKNRPYVIVFCGVNGVGKSTNLAKVAHWLLSHHKSVLVAACDTFRAGAVEQLKTHIQCLQNEFGIGDDKLALYQKGYGADASAIARVAIQFARADSRSVVLVDTAGRMQDNGPLMAALSKLVTVNAPDLVLFVGEALVGNEAVDQLSKFCARLSEDGKCAIDGILLTKFDVVDDKIGAALSMSFTSKKPIVFVGVGQTYSDLVEFEPSMAVELLLS